MKALVIIFFTYLFLKYLGRIIVPILLKRFATKMQDRFSQQFNQKNNNQQPPKQQEGNVTLEKNKISSKNNSDNLGDYVDFEEVEE